jgi:NDP-sugar pyrophosphorylase family protein
MKALVLAAGLGERVRPLTESVPKPMLEVGGRPLIHYPLLMLKRAGISTVVINVHHLAGEIQKRLGDGSSLGLEIIYSPEPTLLGTGGPLNALRDFLGDGTFAVANSDSISDLDVGAMLRFHRERGALATLGLYRPDNLETYSRIEIDSDSRVRRIRLLKSRAPVSFDDYPAELKDCDPATLSPWMYCGAWVAEPAVLDLIPRSAPWSLMTGLFGPMVAQGLPVFGYAHRGYFGTVDDLESYQALVSEFETSPPRLPYLDRK